jgi:hypothetical protein
MSTGHSGNHQFDTLKPVYLQAHKQILGHNEQLTLLENEAQNFYCFDGSFLASRLADAHIVPADIF